MKSLLPKNLPNNLQDSLIKQMLQHFDHYQFFIQNANKKTTFGVNGAAVRENLNREWKLTNFINDDHPVFVINNLNDFQETFSRVLGVVNKLPISVISEVNVFGSTSAKASGISDFFKPTAYTKLLKQTFCSSDEAIACFHRIQKERKIWWRKFSSLPGRFIETEITSCEKEKCQQSEIHAEFLWGAECVEVIKLVDTADLPQIKGLKKPPTAVISESKLETTTLAYLCDAFDPINEETDRKLMRFHRKIAPYQIAFAGISSSDLHDLALLLSRRIRKLNIPCLLIPDVTKKSLAYQFERNDAFGIPYTVVLNEKTLKDGILDLRNRDTTLQEQSHVGILVQYIEQIMRNY